MKRVAQRLESDNPLWLVMFGDYSWEFVAFPRFTAPRGTVVTAHYPAALPSRMREVERRMVPVPAASAEGAAPSVAAASASAAPGGQAVSVSQFDEERSGDVAG
jgi:hypothetical protein